MRMSSLVLDLKKVGKTERMLVGGKGVHLGELSKIQGIQVPDGFCVTTVGYQKSIEQNEMFKALIEKLTCLKVENQKQISQISREIRQIIMETDIPSDVVSEVVTYLARFGEKHAYAVRSSATAEDLPHASFAGQQDTYLNIIGKEPSWSISRNVGLLYLQIAL